MARSLRSAYVCPSENAIFYIRCRTKKSFILPPSQLDSAPDIHRVHYIEDLLRHYAGLFGISVHAHAVMRREFRIVLQSRPDVVFMLSDHEIARRWLCICPTLRRGGTPSPEPTEEKIAVLCGQPLKIAELRQRLSSISWFMRLLQQRVAQLCNREDQTEGRVWNGRFRAVLLLDGTAHLAALVNVDLAAVRVSTGKPISASVFTSAAYRRQESLAMTSHGAGEQKAEDLGGHAGTTQAQFNSTSEVADPVRHGRHLAPISGSDASVAVAGGLSDGANQFRCSHDFALNSAVEEYQQLLQLTRDGFRAAGHTMPRQQCSLLDSLRISREVWVALVGDFDDLFSHVAGKIESMELHVPKRGNRRAHVRAAARAIFGACRWTEKPPRLPHDP